MDLYDKTVIIDAKLDHDFKLVDTLSNSCELFLTKNKEELGRVNQINPSGTQNKCLVMKRRSLYLEESTLIQLCHSSGEKSYLGRDFYPGLAIFF